MRDGRVGQIARYKVAGGERVRIGITPEGQRAVGQTFAVGLPRVGARIRRGDPLVTFRSTSSAVAITAPVAGEVVAVNEHVTERTDDLVNDPYGRGWLLVIAPSGKIDTTALLSREAYEAHVTSRPQRTAWLASPDGTWGTANPLSGIVSPRPRLVVTSTFS